MIKEVETFHENEDTSFEIKVLLMVESEYNKDMGNLQFHLVQIFVGFSKFNSGISWNICSKLYGVSRVSDIATFHTIEKC